MILNADEFRQAIVDIDRLVFENGPVDAARRNALSTQLDALAGRVKSFSNSRCLPLEALELRRLAAAAKDLPPGSPPVSFANEWMRIRSNLFEDQSWFARSAADLEQPATPITPPVASAVAPVAAGPPPLPPAADVPAAIRPLLAELDAQRPAYPQLARVVAIGEQLLPYGAAARPAAAPLANWLRYYSYGSVDPPHEALLRRLRQHREYPRPRGELLRRLEVSVRPGQVGPGPHRDHYFPALRAAAQGAGRSPSFSRRWPTPTSGSGTSQRRGSCSTASPSPSTRDRSPSASCRPPRAPTRGRSRSSARWTNPRGRSASAPCSPAETERDAGAVGRLYDRDKDPLIRTALLDALSDPVARRSSLTVLLDTRIAVPGDRVPFLLAGMGDEQPEVREAARRTLLLCGPTPRALVPMLIAALESGPPAQRKSAAAALTELTERDYGLDAATWRRWREAKLEGEPPQILRPGPHHGDEVPLNADGAWWAICGPKGRRALRQVPVSVRLVNDTGLHADVRGDRCRSRGPRLRRTAGLPAQRAGTESARADGRDSLGGSRWRRLAPVRDGGP